MSVGEGGSTALDYYLVHPGPAGGEPRGRPEGVVVEEFVFAADHSAVRLHSAAWTPQDGGWWSSADFSRTMRLDAALRNRVVAVTRRECGAAYRELGGGELPDEGALRGHFHDAEPLATAPLSLGTTGITAGFHATRVYRVLFVDVLGPDGLAHLRDTGRMTVTGDVADPRARVVGVARRRVGDDEFTWHLRRIGGGGPWCLDLTADLAGSRDGAIRPVLRELTTTLRMRGLLPVTVERLS
ncbi:hypothetical protein GA0070558_14313 [Micromonospora haikouensis]|uniref:Uncharacterized protein n=1 Tax=Micromonospora haikouensis TaxID=686309 RepID=A0A1C4YFU7_9ACTN|nr:hypothetical protein [Micromonospora haikouensis]SCF19221.1 hypothetical protein GA0070558_14313 [Micromonospora haikouensis]